MLFVLIQTPPSKEAQPLFFLICPLCFQKGRGREKGAGIGPRSPGTKESRGKESMEWIFIILLAAKFPSLPGCPTLGVLLITPPLHPHYLDPLDFRTGSPGCQRHVLGSFKVYIHNPRASFIHTASRLSWRPYHWSSGSTWMIQRTRSSSTDEWSSIFCRTLCTRGPMPIQGAWVGPRVECHVADRPVPFPTRAFNGSKWMRSHYNSSAIWGDVTRSSTVGHPRGLVPDESLHTNAGQVCICN